MPRITVSIDGPTASGKTTLATSLAQLLGLTFLDTGITFRSLAYALSRAPATDPHIHLGDHLEHRPAVYGTSGKLTQSHAVFLHGEEITEDILDHSLDYYLKMISRDSALRQKILRMHRRTINECGNTVAVGRDVGATLLPAANLHVYLTASLEVRRERRRAQYRDRNDRSTAVGPPTELDEENRAAIKKLRNSVEIDSTGLSATAVLTRSLNELKRLNIP